MKGPYNEMSINHLQCEICAHYKILFSEMLRPINYFFKRESSREREIRLIKENLEFKMRHVQNQTLKNVVVELDEETTATDLTKEITNIFNEDIQTVVGQNPVETTTTEVVVAPKRKKLVRPQNWRDI